MRARDDRQAADFAVQLEKVLGSSVFPTLLVCVAAFLVLHSHRTEDPDRDVSLKGFLSLILLHMIPLFALQTRVGKCTDPMGLLAQFAPEVLLMHIFFLTPRLVYVVVIQREVLPFFVCVLCLVGGVIALIRGFEFKWSVSSVCSKKSMMFLVAAASIAGFATELWDAVVNTQAYFLFLPIALPNRWIMVGLNALHTTSNYIEIIALVPAVLVVYRSDALASPVDEIANTRKQKQAALFFAFMTGFYIYEDVVQAVFAMWWLPMAAIAHVVHFLLLLDFVAFFLVYVYNLGASKSDLVKAALCMV
eukprot:TRINITY_DN29402_c0_g1_i1.p1 TRINITY_DN29402_c0_g1~~TRINITY_DN29402_c0_g1_i1.p1  ORF type:complete len:305 (-),score=54.88 TRINITY_DN29402_c0_g1_i1:110-1024(-)